MNIYTLLILLHNYVLFSSTSQVCIPSPKWEEKTVLVDSLDFSHSSSVQQIDFANCVQYCYFDGNFEITHFNTSTSTCVCFKTREVVFSYRSTTQQLYSLTVYMQKSSASKFFCE